MRVCFPRLTLLVALFSASCERDHVVGAIFADGGAGAEASGGTGAEGSGGSSGPLGGAGGGTEYGIECSTPCAFPTHRCVADACVRVLPSRSFAMDNSAICLEAGGAILCSGQGSSGQLGAGEPIAERSSFEPTNGPQPLGRVVAGVGDYFMGYSESGRVFAWGSNYAGALGLGDTMDRFAPTFVPGLAEGTFVIPGSGHSCFLSLEGRLSCAGRNVDGELGVGDTSDRWEPVEVPETFAQVSVGWGHTCALSPAGELFCWGLNDEGQLGLGDQETRLSPTSVSSERFRFVSAQVKRTCVIDWEGGLSCWGSNHFGQAGVDSRDLVLVPMTIGAGLEFSMVAGGHFGVCAITTSGELYCWGKPPEDLTNDPSDADLLVPTRVTDDSDFVWVERGYGSACALREDESIWCWGRNQAGQFGTGDVAPRDALTRVGP